MKLRTCSMLLAGGLLTSGLLLAESTPSQALLVLAKTDHTLSIVDPVTLKVIAAMPSGPDPHEVVASSDGKFAYISNYGGGRYNTISPIDLVEQKALPPIDLGALRGPHGLMFVGGKVWFTAEAAKVIGSYDPASQKIDWVLGTGQNRTHMIFVSEDLKWMVTSNVSSATLTIIEKRTGGQGPGGPPQADWDETVVPVGRGAEGFDVSPNGKEIWAANAQDGTVSILDAASKKVVQTLAADVRSANRLKFTPDGKFVLISGSGASGPGGVSPTPDLVVLDATSHAEAKQFKLGGAAGGILMDAEGGRAFVAVSGGNKVEVVDLNSLTLVGEIAPLGQPDGMAWSVRK